MQTWIKNTIALSIFLISIVFCICGIIAGADASSWILFFGMEIIGIIGISGTIQYTTHKFGWVWGE